MRSRSEEDKRMDDKWEALVGVQVASVASLYARKSLAQEQGPEANHKGMAVGKGGKGWEATRGKRYRVRIGDAELDQKKAKKKSRKQNPQGWFSQ